MNTQKVAAERAAALAEDATVFDYDGVYDAMQVAPPRACSSWFSRLRAQGATARYLALRHTSAERTPAAEPPREFTFAA